MLSLLIALAAAQTAPPPSLANVLSVEDYPAEAVAKGWEGTARVQLQISEQGRVSGCKILESSGHPVLNSRTCEIMVQRARFKPARNGRGVAVPDTVEQTITWALEDPEPELPTEPKQ